MTHKRGQGIVLTPPGKPKPPEKTPTEKAIRNRKVMEAHEARLEKKALEDELKEFWD